MLVPQILLVFALTVILSVTSSPSPSFDDSMIIISEEIRIQQCGSRLATTLNIFCKGLYNGVVVKKSDSGEFDWLEELEWESPEKENMIIGPSHRWPFRPKAHAKALELPAGHFRRHSRGIVDDCCRKSCTMKELRSYCDYKM